MGYFVKRSFRKDFRIIFLRERLSLKKLSKKAGASTTRLWGYPRLAPGWDRQGQDSGVTG
jgi:hypothetical protein